MNSLPARVGMSAGNSTSDRRDCGAVAVDGSMRVKLQKTQTCLYAVQQGGTHFMLVNFQPFDGLRNSTDR